MLSEREPCALVRQDREVLRPERLLEERVVDVVPADAQRARCEVAHDDFANAAMPVRVDFKNVLRVSLLVHCDAEGCADDAVTVIAECESV